MILMRHLHRRLLSAVVARRLSQRMTMMTMQMLEMRSLQRRKLVVVRRRLPMMQSWVSKTRQQKRELLERVESRRVLKRLLKTKRTKMWRRK